MVYEAANPECRLSAGKRWRGRSMRLGLPEGSFFSWEHVEPRKNLPVLLKAFASISNGSEGAPGRGRAPRMALRGGVQDPRRTGLGER